MQQDIVMKFSLVDRELNVDLGSSASTPVRVDDVHGQLSRLGSDDFTRPVDSDVYQALHRNWYYDRTVYLGLLSSPERQISPKRPVIVLQWNRDGKHYLLVAQDKEPFTEEELLKVANSMVESELDLYFDAFRGPKKSIN